MTFAENRKYGVPEFAGTEVNRHSGKLKGLSGYLQFHDKLPTKTHGVLDTVLAIVIVNVPLYVCVWCLDASHRSMAMPLHCSMSLLLLPSMAWPSLILFLMELCATRWPV